MEVQKSVLTENIKVGDVIEVMNKFYKVTSIDKGGIHPTVKKECFSFNFFDRLSITAFIGEYWRRKEIE